MLHEHAACGAACLTFVVFRATIINAVNAFNSKAAINEQRSDRYDLSERCSLIAAKVLLIAYANHFWLVVLKYSIIPV